MYHSQLGRFCSRDPVGYAGSQWDLYEYVSSSPLAATDSSGLYERTPGIRECCELYGSSIVSQIQGILDDEDHDRWFRNRERRRGRPWQGYEQGHRETCQKLRRILECLLVVYGPWPGELNDIFDKVRFAVDRFCGDPPPRPPQQPVPDPVPIGEPIPDPVHRPVPSLPDVPPVVVPIPAVEPAPLPRPGISKPPWYKTIPFPTFWDLPLLPFPEIYLPPPPGQRKIA